MQALQRALVYMDTEAAFGANVVTTLDGELRAATVTFVLDAFDVHLIVESILRYLHEKIVVNFQTDVIRRHKCLFSPTAPHSVVKDKKRPAPGQTGTGQRKGITIKG
jgi:hypothetical protein